MKIYIFRKNIISCTHNTNSIHFNYFVMCLLIVRTDCVKDLWAVLDTKLYFHRPVNYLACCRELKLLGLIHFVTHNFSSLDSLKVLYIVSIRSKLEYAFIVCDNLT
jgi:hypothetical protein